jgi:peptide/nickel transport system ATP-binding protein
MADIKHTELLRVENLKKFFTTPNGTLHAVDDVTFAINKGETLGVVGESGCGKSTLGRTILRLHEPTEGKVFFEGKEITNLGKNDMKKLRRDMQIIFQDPFASLNPRMTVAETIGESLLIQKIFTRRQGTELRARIANLMELVGLSSRLINSYPHELDGGRRQRIGIARVLALDPKFVVCDEPVSALDVSIQAQILNLMQDLQDEFGLTYLFITHDLSVVKHLSNDILVMYLGQMVEMAPSDILFKNPLHPYTQALLSSIPVPDPDYKTDRVLLKGELTSPIDPKPGCRFANRCPYVCDACRKGPIPFKEIEKGHFVACTKL